MGRTPTAPENFKKTHVRKKENEMEMNIWVEERAKQTFISYLIWIIYTNSEYIYDIYMY